MSEPRQATGPVFATLESLVSTMPRFTAIRRPRQGVMVAGSLVCALGLTACASSSVTETGGMSSYGGMTTVKTMRTKARFFADAEALASARTVRIEPATYGAGAGDRISAGQRALIANLIARVLCVKLSDRYDIADGPGPADMTIRTVITRLTPTNREAAAASVPIRAASMVFGIPMPARIPLGMGSFSAEGEALDRKGGPRAVMVWARGADVVTSRARVSKIGDAYELSAAFAGDLAGLVVTGKNPLHDIPKNMFARRARPVPAACDVYGKANGAEGFIEGFVGAPPEWSDGKPKAETAPSTTTPHS